MKILLIGAYGQLGTEFRRFFEEKGITYLPISRNKRDDKTIVADITNEENLREILGNNNIDLVINFSAYNNVDKAEYEEYHNAWLTNTFAISNLSSLCKKYNIPIIHYSTDYVFNGEKKQPYVETDKPIPVNRYGITKLGGEEFLRYTWDKHIILRVSWVFGKGGETNFIKKLLKWSEGGSVKVSTDEVSAPTYTETIVKASWELYANKMYGTYHLSNEGECSRYEYAKFILESVGWKGNLIEAKQSDFNLPAKRPNYSKLNSSKLKNTVKIDIPHWKDVVKKYLKEEYNL